MAVDAVATLRYLDRLSMATLVEIRNQQAKERKALALHYFLLKEGDDALLRNLLGMTLLVDILDDEIKARMQLMRDLAESGELDLEEEE